jgi:ATP-binding cassette subfamily B (MDR/TAP) protein 1
MLRSIPRTRFLLQNTNSQFHTLAFCEFVREILPIIPYKPLLFLGLFTCIASGAMAPVFFFLLSRLLFEVSTGAYNISTTNFFGRVVHLSHE